MTDQEKIEQLEKKVKELEKKVKTEKEISKADRVALDKQELEILISQNKVLGEKNNKIQNEIKLRTLLEQQADAAYQSEQDLRDLRDEKAAAVNQMLSDEKEAELARLERLAAEKAANATLLAQLRQNTAGVEEYTEAQKKARKVFDDGFTSIGEKLFLIDSGANAFVKKLTEFGKLGKDNVDVLGQSFADTFNAKTLAIGLLANVIEKTLEFSSAVDKASAAFAANTGAGRIMTAEISAVGGSFRNLGIGAEDAGKAAESLFNGFTGFMQLSGTARKDLMKTVASLEKFGISGENASQALQLMTHNFGESTSEASRMTKQLAIAGTKIGISASKMMDGFVQASKSLAVYGKDSIKVFTDLAAQAKAAGVEAATLLGIAEKFDTFSSAADAAGKLNSILGTQMSAVELLTMKENERVETLIRSIQAQGRNFKDMDRFSQKAIANAAGITDMAEAQRIFSMSVNDYRKGLRENASQEEFNQRLKDAMDIFKKLEMAAQNFAIQFSPVIDMVASAVQTFLDFSQSMNGVPVMILGIAAAIGVLLVLAPAIISFFTVALPAMFAGLTAGAPILGTIGAIIGGVLVYALASLVATIAMLNLEKLQSLATIFGGLSQMGQVSVAVDAIDDFTDSLDDKSATLKPILGDLALIATGKTTQSVTTNTVGYSLNTFAAKFENTFKPNVTVKIGNKEIESFIVDTTNKANVNPN